jgi:hypothetical protein
MVLVAAVALALVMIAGSVAPAAAAPEGEMTWAIHVSLAPSWFDPAETPSVITPFMMLYALSSARGPEAQSGNSSWAHARWAAASARRKRNPASVAKCSSMSVSPTWQ